MTYEITELRISDDVVNSIHTCKTFEEMMDYCHEREVASEHDTRFHSPEIYFMVEVYQ